MEEKDIQFVERYLEGRLSPDEVEVLEEKQASDNEFNELVQQMKLLIPGIQYSARNRMLQELKGFEAKLTPVDIHKEGKRGKVVPIYGYRRFAAMAASLILVVVFTFLMINSQKGLNPEEAFASYYTPYQNVVAPIKRGEDGVANLKEEAAYAYENGDYAQAVELFEQLDESQVDAAVLICKGNAYIGIEKYSQALATMDEIILNDGVMVPQAYWYKGLIYLKQGNVDAAKVILKKLENGGSSYTAKASQLLNELK